MQSNPTWDRIQGKWKQAVGAVHIQWGKLTDNDLSMLTGEREQLAGLIQERYGITRQEARQQIDKWSEKIKDRI